LEEIGRRTLHKRLHRLVQITYKGERGAA